MTRRSPARVALALTLLVAPVSAGPKSRVAPARESDVGSVDGIVRAYYEVISGPPGAPRQWARDRSLYVEGVRFVAVETGPKGPRMRVVTHEQFVRWVNAEMVRLGFFEREIHRETRRYGNLVQVFSTYESRTREDGPVTARGVNSLELVFDGRRWWIAAATWQDETPDAPIPKELLPE